MMETDHSGNQISPSKKLQHAILQLCNEYVTYDRTLQVLGVICLTIDDQQPEIIVKVNNTLKRFKEPDSINLINSLQKADAKAAKLLNLTGPISPRIGQENPEHKTSKSQGSGSGKFKMGLRSGKGLRKGHGRKQSKPIKVNPTVQVDFTNDHSSNDELVIEKNNESMETELDQSNTTDIDEDTAREASETKSSDEPPIIKNKKRPFQNLEPLDENLAKISKLPEDELEFQEIEDASALLDAESDEDLKRLVIIEPLENNIDNMNESTMPSFDAALASLNEVDLDETSRLHTNEIIHIKEEPIFQDDENLGTTELERLLKGDKSKPRQKNVLEASQYQIEPRLIQAVAPVTRQLLPAPSALLSNQIFAILPNTATVQPQTQTSGLARLLQPTTFYAVTDKNVQNTNNNCFSLQLTQMAKNVLKLPDNATQTITNQIPIIKPSTSQTNALITLNRQPNNESDYLLDSFAAEPELLTKIGLKSSTLNTDANISKKAHRRRVCEDVLTPEEIVEYVGSTDEAASSAALQRPYKCNCCDKTLHNLLEYFRHTLKVHNAFVCHQCGKDFSTKSSLLRHRPIHTGLRRFACGICQKSFYRKDKCKSHIKMHFRFGPSTTSASSSSASNATIVQSGITTQFVSLPTFVVPTSENMMG